MMSPPLAQGRASWAGLTGRRFWPPAPPAAMSGHSLQARARSPPPLLPAATGLHWVSAPGAQPNAPGPSLHPSSAGPDAGRRGGTHAAPRRRAPARGTRCVGEEEQPWERGRGLVPAGPGTRERPATGPPPRQRSAGRASGVALTHREGGSARGAATSARVAGAYGASEASDASGAPDAFGWWDSGRPRGETRSPEATTGAAEWGQVQARTRQQGPVWEMPWGSTTPDDEEAREMLEQLVQHVRERGCPPGGANVVAFSGGVDSSLVAYMVHRAFAGDSEVVSAACIGLSPALATWQLEAARDVARHIGLPLWEVQTEEGQIPEYVANQGQSCFHCKMTLYSTLRAVASRSALALPGPCLAGPVPSLEPEGAEMGGVRQHHEEGAWGSQEWASPVGRAMTNTGVVLFNGTNADDLRDPTRLGLLAALQHRVESPLACLPKTHVRALAQAAGLPNSQLAASPCLRSRLQLGVPATPGTLSAVGTVEHQVRTLLQLESSRSMRIRVLQPSGDGGLSSPGEPVMLLSRRDAQHPSFSETNGPPRLGGAMRHRQGDATVEETNHWRISSLEGYSLLLEVEDSFVPRADALRREIEALVCPLGAVYAGVRTFRSGSLANVTGV